MEKIFLKIEIENKQVHLSSNGEFSELSNAFVTIMEQNPTIFGMLSRSFSIFHERMYSKLTEIEKNKELVQKGGHHG